MSTQAAGTAVQAEIVVDAPIERAFAVFTEGIGSWFPSEYNLLAVDIAERVFEPRVGGQVYDRGVDGTECHWGARARLRAAEPGRLQLGHRPAVADRDRSREDERGRGAVQLRGARPHPRRARAPQPRAPRRRLGEHPRRAQRRGRLGVGPAGLRATSQPDPRPPIRQAKGPQTRAFRAVVGRAWRRRGSRRCGALVVVGASDPSSPAVRPDSEKRAAGPRGARARAPRGCLGGAEPERDAVGAPLATEQRGFEQAAVLAQALVGRVLGAHSHAIGASARAGRWREFVMGSVPTEPGLARLRLAGADDRRAGVLVHAVRLGDLDLDQARAASACSNSARVSAPAMQPVHCCMSARVASSMSSSAITSEIAKRPPGLSTRAVSRSTLRLSPARLTTQLEMTTSTVSSGSGISSR